MAFFNKNLWKQAYLLEFCQNTIVKEAFAFSVPPQSEEFVYPQRVSETKTFGGSVFEDYGNDTIQITLSGTTINQELKTIYRGNKPKKRLSGEDEIFYLKDIIEEYGKFKNLANKRVYLYELTGGKKTKSVLNVTKVNHKCWRVFIQEFDIKRTKEKPFTYDYTLKCLAIPIDKSITPEWTTDFISDYNEFKAELDEAIERLNNTLGFITDISEFCDKIIALNELINAGFQEILDYFSYGIDKISYLVSEVTAVGDSVANVLPNMIISISSLVSSCTELVEECVKLKEWYDDVKKGKNFEQAVAYFEADKQDFEDACTKLVNKVHKNANSINYIVNQTVQENAEFPIVLPGEDGNSDSLAMAYGYKEISYKSGDTWSSIAFEAYCDSSYAKMLQLYNSQIELENLEAGAVIYIPLLQKESSNSNNKVISEFGEKDVFGKDILVADNDFFVSNGDLKTSEGVHTVQQAIENRLNTTINSRVRNVVYGIRKEIGLVTDESEACASYISSSIEQTILADPRVESIESLQWSGSGESVNVKVQYTTIVGSTQYYEGVI